MESACLALEQYREKSLVYKHNDPSLETLDLVPNLVVSQLLRSTDDLAQVQTLLELLYYYEIHPDFEGLYLNCCTFSDLLLSSG